MSSPRDHTADMQETLRVRRYEASDRDDVWLLHRLALEPTGAIPRYADWADDLHHIEDVYLDRGGEFLVGVIDREIVAMGALRRTSEDRAEIRRMRVHPEFQRRGLGERLLEALESRAAELGYVTLHLETTVQQHAAQRLYLKSGYAEVGRGVVDGFEVIRYEKAIDSA